MSLADLMFSDEASITERPDGQVCARFSRCLFLLLLLFVFLVASVSRYRPQTQDQDH
jgi:hypothetical protein